MIHCIHCGAAQPTPADRCAVCGRPLEPRELPGLDPDRSAPAQPQAACGADAASTPPEDHPAEPEMPPVSGHITFVPDPEPPTHPRQPASAPKYDRVLPQQPDGGLTTAQYFWTLMLFAIPVVGLGFMLFWSFGNTASPAHRRLARASLIKAGVGLASALATLLVVGALAFQMTQSYWLSRYGGHSGSYGWYGSYFEDPYDWPFDFFENSGKNERIY